MCQFLRHCFCRSSLHFQHAAVRIESGVQHAVLLASHVYSHLLLLSTRHVMSWITPAVQRDCLVLRVQLQ